MVRDIEQEQLRMLRAIAQGVGQSPEQDITLEGSNIQQRVGLVPDKTIVVKEASQLDHANPDGSVTLSPGEEKVIARYDRGAHAVYGYGATDNADVQYKLEIDSDPAVGPTNSPLGTVNSPFSFVKMYGGALPAEKRTELKAQYSSNASGDIDMVGRLHIEVMG